MDFKYLQCDCAIQVLRSLCSSSVMIAIILKLLSKRQPITKLDDDKVYTVIISNS